MRNLILPFVILLAAPAMAQQAEPVSAPVDPTAQDAPVSFGAPEPVILATAEGEHTVLAELALTEDQMQRGLMWRDALEPGHGMLFHYDPPRRAAMWMENTLIDLDIVFIDAEGRITKIIGYAQAGSRRSLPADGEVSGVLELAAGQAFELGLRPGDIVRHAIFGNTDAPAANEETAPEAAADTP